MKGFTKEGAPSAPLTSADTKSYGTTANPAPEEGSSSKCKKPACCNLADRVGCIPERFRTWVIGFDLLLMVVSFILCLLAVLGLSSSTGVMKSLPWSSLSTGDDKTTDFTIYQNLWGLYVEGAPASACALGEARTGLDMCSGASWEDLAEVHPDLFNLNYTYFDDCKTAAEACRGLAILAILLAVMAIVSRSYLNNRFDLATDSGKKCIVLITCAIPLIMNLSTVEVYREMCVHALNDAIDDLSPGDLFYDTDIQGGAGFISSYVSLIFFAVSFALQMSVPGRV